MQAENGLGLLLVGLRGDYDLLLLHNEGLKRRSLCLALLLHPPLRAGILMRICSHGGILTHPFRALLRRNYASEVGPGAIIVGALYVPHPVGIVVGQGVVIEDGVTLYQGVTLGASGRGGYPRLEERSVVYPNAVVVGGVVIGRDARVSAGTLCRKSVGAGETYV